MYQDSIVEMETESVSMRFKKFEERMEPLV